MALSNGNRIWTISLEALSIFWKASGYTRLCSIVLFGWLLLPGIGFGQVDPGEIAAAQTICSGDDPAAFTSEEPATGNGDISYQWQISTDGILFSDIPSATLEIYDSGLLTSDTWFKRVATDDNGSDDSQCFENHR